ncbi:MAG: TIGR02147 family protein [Chitinivibrionales bacterium]
MNNARKNNPVLKSLFNYEDYRVFLRDFFDEQKKNKKFFSQRYFAQKAGFSSHSFCTFIINGKRNLSERSIDKMLRGLGLKGKQAVYFENLVRYNQAKSIQERDSYYKSLLKLRKQDDFYKLNKKQLSYYEKWYYPVIRELVCFTKWGNSYKELAEMVSPKITEKEAQEAVETLEKIGLIKRDENGEFYPVREVVTSENIPAFIKKHARRDILLKGVEAAEKLSPDKRYTAYTTLAMDRDTYKRVIRKLDEIRREIILNAGDKRRPDDVYHLIFELFPSSNVDGSAKKEYNGGKNEDV